MRAQARREAEPPLLDPVSDELLVLEFAAAGRCESLDFLGNASGINVTYDAEFEGGPASLDLADVTFEEALAQLLSSHGAFYKVVNPTTIVVVPDTPRSAGSTTSRRSARSTFRTAMWRSSWGCSRGCCRRRR